MTRTAPIDPRPVRDAATAALGRPVDAVEPTTPGGYALELRDCGAPTLNIARGGDDERCLVAPCLLDALEDTGIPTPTLLAAVGPDTSPLGSSFCILRAEGDSGSRTCSRCRTLRTSNWSGKRARTSPRCTAPTLAPGPPRTAAVR